MVVRRFLSSTITIHALAFAIAFMALENQNTQTYVDENRDDSPNTMEEKLQFSRQEFRAFVEETRKQAEPQIGQSLLTPVNSDSSGDASN